MALRPFARQKKKSDDDATPSASVEFEQFFSNDPRPAAPSEAGGGAGEPAPSSPAPAVNDDAKPGWYPDASDPTLMRYWDGFHLTGQTMRVEAPAGTDTAAGADAPDAASVGSQAGWANPGPSATDLLAPPAPPAAPARPAPPVTAARPAPPAAATAPAGPARPAPPAPPAGAATPPLTQPARAASPLKPLAPGFNSPPAAPVAPVAPVAPAAAADPVDEGTVSGEEPAAVSEATVEPESAAGAAPVGEVETPGAPVEAEDESHRVAADQAHNNEGSDSVMPTGPTENVQTEDEANNWAEEAERAVARAQKAGTPEAWQEVAQAATVVSEMAQTMRAVADASLLAEQMEQAAQEASQRAQVAAQTAAAADLTVRQAAKAAEEASETAKVAAEAAADAERKAEQAAQAVPMVSEAAKTAARKAEEAKRKARGVEEIVTKARQVNTPAAWSAALEQVTAATADSDTDGGASDRGVARGWSAGRFSDGPTGR